LALDLWALRDWLEHDPSNPLTKEHLDSFVSSSDGFHVRACADLATRIKHFRVDHSLRHFTALIPENDFSQSPPILFSVRKVYQAPWPQGASRAGERISTQDEDHYEDAMELMRRALSAWEAFLSQENLL
jgi:hypothetical protein